MGDVANREPAGDTSRADELDAQHEELVALMARIIKRGSEGALKAELCLLLRQLLIRTRHHFLEEEAFMRATGYARLDTHQIMHAQLMDALSKHVLEFEAGDGKLAPKMGTFLKYWLMAHINGMDAELVRRPSPPPRSSLVPTRKR